MLQKRIITERTRRERPLCRYEIEMKYMGNCTDTNIEVYIENEQDKYVFTDELRRIIETAAQTVLNQEGFEPECEVSVTITDNDYIQSLNAQHRGKDTATDVLSFPMLDFDECGEPISDFIMDEDDTLSLGDIVISLERAVSQAIEYGHSLEREVGFLTAHSMLHLLGYDHEDDEDARAVMREKEEAVMDAMGLTR